MNDTTNTFTRLRPRLQGIAYRMLGSSAEAEEVVQDAWLRWHEADQDHLDNTEAWLVSVTTRLAIDRLRAAKIQREHYIGTWLPEPLLCGSPVSPEQVLERADVGSGQSNLLSLRRLAVTSLQLDRSLVKHCSTDSDLQAVIKAIVASARALDLGVGAKGVETAAQLDQLRKLCLAPASHGSFPK